MEIFLDSCAAVICLYFPGQVYMGFITMKLILLYGKEIPYYFIYMILTFKTFQSIFYNVKWKYSVLDNSLTRLRNTLLSYHKDITYCHG